MALIKKVMTDYGIEASYWRVTMITIDKPAKQASCVMGLYINKEAVKSIDTRCVSELMLQENSGLFDKYFGVGNEYTDVYNACYMLAKEQDDYFKDAEDDKEYTESQNNI